MSRIQASIDEYRLLKLDIEQRIELLRAQLEVDSKRTLEVDESVQVETLRFETDTAVQVNTLPPLMRMSSITSKDAYMYELETALIEGSSNVTALQDLVDSSIPKQGSPEVASSAKILVKLIAACQSSVELIRHLSTTLLTDCGATEEEAKSQQVASISNKLEELMLRAKAREQKIREVRYVPRRYLRNNA